MVAPFDVSVVIPVYNGERFVAEAIRSALKQTLRPREVIVVDDGSTDGTPDILADFGGQIKVVSQPNSGISAARNAGIRLATGEWIGVLDADDEWRVNKIERMAAACSKLPSLGMVFCAVRHWWEGSGESQVCCRARDLGCKEILTELMSRNVILGGGSGPVIRRDCFQVVGLFDEALQAAEDWDMWIRIAFRYEIGYIDEILVERREHAESLSKDIDRMLVYDLRVLEKHADTRRAQGTSLWQLRRAKAAVYARSGVAYFCSGETAKARRVLVKALLLDPFNIKAGVPMAKLLLGITHKPES